MSSDPASPRVVIVHAHPGAETVARVELNQQRAIALAGDLIACARFELS